MKYKLMLYGVVYLMHLLGVNAQSSNNDNNMIINGDFEIFESAPFSKDLMMEYRSHFVCFSTKSRSTLFSVDSWSIPSAGTPDFHVDSRCKNLACAGIYLTNEDEYREFLQMMLSVPMLKDSVYHLSFHINFNDKDSTVVSKFDPPSLGLSFDINKRPYNSIVFPFYQGRVWQLKLPKLQKGVWVKMEFDYTAKGGERFITIGNFLRDQAIPKLTDTPVKDRLSYILIDDFYIEKKQALVSKHEITYSQGAYSISVSDAEKLSSLIETANNNCHTIKYTITSSASEEGNEKLNTELALRRAEEVQKTIIRYGVDVDSIEIINNGEKENIRRSIITAHCN